MATTHTCHIPNVYCQTLAEEGWARGGRGRGLVYRLAGVPLWNSIHLFYSDVVRLERPDLEQQRNELILIINKAKNELKVRTFLWFHFGLIICDVDDRV